ncbi:MAG: metallopeptidase TldD-related protein [Planctomycetota bacterium]
MKSICSHGFVLALLACAEVVAPLARLEADDEDVVIRALVDELKRSMTLQLEDLAKPYFIQYTVDEGVTQRISASYGALVDSDRTQSRRLQNQVRVGGPDLDNTNFQGSGGAGGRGIGARGAGGGGAAALPIDDDYTALRQVIWRATDQAYKSAVETFTEKRAYMEGKELTDRPQDFSPGSKVERISPKVRLDPEVAAWEAKLRELSKRFNDYAHVLDASVDLAAWARNRYLVNSEGTRVRDGDAGVTLTLRAEVQADDGQRLFDQLEYRADAVAKLPSVEVIAADLDAFAARLKKLRDAPRLDEFRGPVLFDGAASAQLFFELLGAGVAGQPEAVGTQRRRFRESESLEKRVGKKILPDSMNVYDDPRAPSYQGQTLAGYYEIDDEGTPAERVDLVVEGKLTELLMSRVPTKQFQESNGHGRRGLGGAPRAAAACLYVESQAGKPADELKQALIAAAKEQGLEYALRVSSLGGSPAGGRAGAGGRPGGRAGARGAGGGGESALVSDPLSILKVYVADGREERVRACEFNELDVATLRTIAATGNHGTVLNTNVGSAPVSVIAPAILLDEVELVGIQDEAQRKPTLLPPHARPVTAPQKSGAKTGSLKFKPKTMSFNALSEDEAKKIETTVNRYLHFCGIDGTAHIDGDLLEIQGIRGVTESEMTTLLNDCGQIVIYRNAKPQDADYATRSKRVLRMKRMSDLSAEVYESPRCVLGEKFVEKYEESIDMFGKPALCIWLKEDAQGAFFEFVNENVPVHLTWALGTRVLSTVTVVEVLGRDRRVGWISLENAKLARPFLELLEFGSLPDELAWVEDK